MLERLLFRAENEEKYLLLFLELLVVFIFLLLFNRLLGGDYLFLVALCSLSISYPVTKFIRKIDHTELLPHTVRDIVELFRRQLIVFWIVFITSVLVFAIGFSHIKNTSFHQAVISALSGFMINTDLSFFDIFLNNISVGFLGMGIAFISTSTLVFLIIWNASLLAYVVQSAQNITALLGYLPHGLLEIGGFVLLGLAGSLTSYRLERYSRFTADANRYLFRNVALLLVFGIILITMAAFFETL